MELIERYLYAVTHQLPVEQRKDIEQELRGLIADMLDERMQGEAPTEKETEEVLIELGNPSELAAKYRGYKKYLIGPDYFDTYLVILKVVGISILIGLSVVFAIEFIMSPLNVIDQIINYIGTVISAGAQGFLWVTIIFWLIEYKGVKADKVGIDKSVEWSPAQLPSIPNPKNQIKRSDPIAGIIFTVLFMVLFIFSNNLLGVIRIGSEETQIIPFFDIEIFQGFLPYLYALFGLGILRECSKLIMKQWSMKLAVYCLLFNIVSFVIAFIMLQDQAIWNPNFISHLVDSGVLVIGSEGYDSVSSIWSISTGRMIHMIGIVLVLDTIMAFIKASRVRG